MSATGNRSFPSQAAVLVAIREQDGRDEILLTLRAEHLNIHRGEVAFPGGKWELGDDDLLATALRESYEEVGLCDQSLQIIQELPSSFTRHGTRVTPFVAKVVEPLLLTPNTDELSDLFWFPIDILHDDSRVRTDVFEHKGSEYWAPVYRYQGFTIWGFTARVLVQLRELYYGLESCREHSAPEVRFDSK